MLSLFLVHGWGAAMLQAQAPVSPTVTVKMGDAGGKIFGRFPDPAKTRRYYIAAEPEMWDYVPEGEDIVCGKPLPPPLTKNRTVSKLRYVQYTDGTFNARMFATPRLGILGPVLRGVVGEYLAVTFLNRTPQPLSMHPHGVKYDKDNEGSYYQPSPGLGSAVAPGARFTYVWQLDKDSGPLPGEPSSKGWLYHSHVTGDDEVNQGLVGFIIVTDPARARRDGTPSDVDREMPALFMIFDESGLGADVKEASEYVGPPGGGPPPRPWAEIQQLVEEGARHAINGRVYGNLAGLEMNEGERVRWYLFGLGSEQDFHTAHWHGMRVIEDGRRRTDVVELMPASMKIADMRADNPGQWLLHCHVADHMMDGMFARYIIHSKTGPGASRAPDIAFLGMPAAQPTLQFGRAEIVPAEDASSTDIVLGGSVTVFEAFSVFNHALTLQLLDKSLTFHPDVHGVANDPEGALLVKNAGSFGVVSGGVMKFEIVLKGPGWSDALKKLSKPKHGKGSQDTLEATLDVGDVKHRADIRLQQVPIDPSQRN